MKAEGRFRAKHPWGGGGGGRTKRHKEKEGKEFKEAGRSQQIPF